MSDKTKGGSSKKVGMFSLICIFVAYGVTLNTFTVGSQNAGHMPFWTGILMIVIGWVFLAGSGALSGVMGYESGYRAPQGFEATFGTWGYKVPSILASVALIGFAAFDYWYVGAALMNLFPKLGAAAFYIGIVVIVAAAVLGSIKDITSLKWLTTSTVPIALVLFFVILFVTVNRGGGFGVLVNYKPPTEGVPLIIGANIMFSCWSSTVPGFMDLTTQAKSRKCCIIAVPVGMLAIAFQYFVGQLGTYVFDGVNDFTSLSVALGGGLAIVCNLFTLFAQANTVPASTIMITSHLTSSLGIPRLAVIIGQPLIAAALAIAMFLGADISVINVFGTFVGFLFAPIMGAMFAEFYVIGKKKFRPREELGKALPSGLITLVVGFVIGLIFYLTNLQVPAAFILIIFCFFLQIILRKGCKLK